MIYQIIADKLMVIVLPLAVLMLWSTTKAVPVYGTTRYGRPAWAYRSAPSYYRQPYPFVQSYPEDVYYQPDPLMHYPYYAAVSRPFTKSEVYQTLYPYYYSDRPRPYAGYYSEDLPEDMHEDELRTNGRSDALPVGQETWFEGESLPKWQNDYDDVNAAFLQNLIMSQVYNDAAKNEQNDSDKASSSDKQLQQLQSQQQPEPSFSEYYGDRDTRDFEDEDVRELKALAGKPLYHVPKTNGYSDKKYKQPQWQMDYPNPSNVQDHYSDDYPSDEAWINWSSKRADKSIGKSQHKSSTKTTVMPPPVTTTAAPGVKLSTVAPMKGGQKEEVLLRPATPVRHPFPEPVLQMLASNSAQKKRTPSVYDTIKQMLSMEEPFAPNAEGIENKPRMQKRFVATEEDLVGELKGLKRWSRA